MSDIIGLPPLPAGWRLVEMDEVILKTDQCAGSSGYWNLVTQSAGKTPAEWKRLNRFVWLGWATNREANKPQEKEWMNPWD
jgi:hypothetical protein